MQNKCKSDTVNEKQKSCNIQWNRDSNKDIELELQLINLKFLIIYV